MLTGRLQNTDLLLAFFAWDGGKKQMGKKPQYPTEVQELIKPQERITELKYTQDGKDLCYELLQLPSHHH